MRVLKHLFDNNRRWAEQMRRDDPCFFEALAQQQKPPYLWIGCADSRVPANQIVGLPPGEVFVHRNVANVVSHTDLNCLSVLQYAVEVLKVKHVIVCGHYGCGGVAAALADTPFGLIDNWLRLIKDVYDRNADDALEQCDTEARTNALCELNVIAQVYNVCHTTIVQDAWRRGQELDVHGWIYSLHDGLLQDLGICISNADHLAQIYRMRGPGSRLPAPSHGKSES
ncbi:MAG: carbonate dehydratase [Nannocystaceae bacterium]|nr:carbonate dehydratase [Myxococcales bacterium]